MQRKVLYYFLDLDTKTLFKETANGYYLQEGNILVDEKDELVKKITSKKVIDLLEKGRYYGRPLIRFDTTRNLNRKFVENCKLFEGEKKALEEVRKILDLIDSGRGYEI